MDDFTGRSRLSMEVDDLMLYFTIDHLRQPEMREVAGSYCDLARTLRDALRDSPELRDALVSLLKAKDAALAAVRAQQSSPSV